MPWLVTQPCLTLCNPMDCSPPAPLSMDFSREEYWNGLLCPPPGGLPDPGIKPRSPTGRFYCLSFLKLSREIQLSLTLCYPMDCIPPGSSVCGILQARTLKWVVMPFPRGSSQPRDQIQVSCIAGRFFTI